MSQPCDRPTSIGPDFFGLFEREVSDLLSSSSHQTIPGEVTTSENNNGQGFRNCNKNKRMFGDIMVNSISEEKQELLKPLLRRSLNTLTTEVDEISDPVFRICHILSLLRMKKQGLCAQHSDGQESMGRPCKRIKVDKNLKSLLEYPDSLLVEERIKKQSEELSATLNYMEKCLGNLLDTTVSHCRPMSHQEKRRLGDLIQKLPAENRKIVAEMISQGKETTVKRSCRSADVSNELFKLDKSKLWRLYFYVNAVEGAKSGSTKKPPL